MTEALFQTFRLGDIFEQLKVKKATVSRLSESPSDEFPIPVVYAKKGDNGIMYWGKKDEFTTYSNVISIVYNGVVAAGKVYAQERPTGIRAESYFIRLKNNIKIPFKANLYMAIVIEHKIYPKYSRENLAIWEGRVENEYIKLPVLSNNTKSIDFGYMVDYITKIERECIINMENRHENEYNKMLEVTGLKNCILSKDDESILKIFGNKEEFDNQNKLIYQDFYINQIFNIYNTHSILKEDVVFDSGKIPYLTATKKNNSVLSYVSCDKELIEEGNCIFIGGKTMVITYQELDFCSNDSHNLALYMKDKIHRNRYVQLFMVAALSASLSAKYSWNDSISKRKIMGDTVSLPVTAPNEIAFDYMEQYIKSLEKIVIMDSVKEKSKKLEITKKITNKGRNY